MSTSSAQQVVDKAKEKGEEVAHALEGQKADAAGEESPRSVFTSLTAPVTKLGQKMGKLFSKAKKETKETKDKETEPEVALGGADPVELADTGEVAKGDSEISSGAFLFASEEHKEAFEKEPEKYTPVVESYCVWALSKGKGKLVPGVPEHAVRHEGKTLLFHSAEHKKAFVVESSAKKQGEVLKAASESLPSLLKKKGKGKEGSASGLGKLFKSSKKEVEGKKKEVEEKASEQGGGGGIADLAKEAKEDVLTAAGEMSEAVQNAAGKASSAAAKGGEKVKELTKGKKK